MVSRGTEAALPSDLWIRKFAFRVVVAEQILRAGPRVFSARAWVVWKLWIPGQRQRAPPIRLLEEVGESLVTALAAVNISAVGDLKVAPQAEREVAQQQTVDSYEAQILLANQAAAN